MIWWNVLFERCGMDKVFADFAIYCWYKGCWFGQIGHRIESRWLYVMRDVNDVAIVWQEGMYEAE